MFCLGFAFIHILGHIGYALGMNHQEIEKKWQARWQEARVFEVDLDTTPADQKFYHLNMFAYPSGNLHIGHWYNFAVSDIVARFTRRQGKIVLNPMGYDAFGLPAENAAIKNNLPPAEWTKQNIAKMRQQLISTGGSFDWSKEISTADPEYYKWTQWMFLKMFEWGLAERRQAPVNWCPKDQTILANEQVVGGKCERCGTEVITRNIPQWVFKITNYAERLLDDLDDLDWPAKTKAMQTNWIGRSEGACISFVCHPERSPEGVKPRDRWANHASEQPTFNDSSAPSANADFGRNDTRIEVFTTRPDTLFGVTYLVIAPEHPLLNQLTTPEQAEAVLAYVTAAGKKSELERTELQKDKTGVFTGAYATHPLTGEQVPIWVADYVIGSYGTGAVMAVPAHDQRDVEFARKYNLPIKTVIQRPEVDEPRADGDMTSDGILRNSRRSHPASRACGDPGAVAQDDDSFECFTGEGILTNSGQFNGLPSQEAKTKIVEDLAAHDKGKATVTYRLRDWIVSRQRYWGAPIPIIYCDKCGTVPVPEAELPVMLPTDVDFRPTGESPLARSEQFVNTTCPQCGGPAKRETDTLDTFVDSSWYFFRYLDPHNTEEFARMDRMQKWMPVDLYVGGAEHSVLHLLYARFLTKALFDHDLSPVPEPFAKLRHQGTILGPDGNKMSKSKGNVIDPDELVAEHGADAVRMYLAFMGPYDQGGPWSPGGIKGVERFLARVERVISKRDSSPLPQAEALNDENINDRHSENVPLGTFEESRNASESRDATKHRHQIIKKVTENTKTLRFNTAISALMEWLNELEKRGASAEDKLTLVSLLNPYAPHLSEELWETLGKQQFLATKPWPEFDATQIADDTVTIAVQVNGKLRGTFEAQTGEQQDVLITTAKTLPNVAKYLTSAPRKSIVIPDKLVSFVS